MSFKLTTKQKALVFGVPVGVLLVSMVAYGIWGNAALLIPPVGIGAFLAYLIVETRHYNLGLFVRQTTESRDHYRQVEAILGLTWAIDPSVPLPPSRGWAASPDLLREVYRNVLEEPPNLVVEASSGTSTLVIAYALRRLGKGHVIALEHDASYAEQTRNHVIRHGLEGWATVVHAPLVMQQVEGKPMQWYDIRGVEFPAPIDLLVVDGPPDTVQPMARYPAVPMLRSRFGQSTRVFLDDGSREDERRTAERWAELFHGTKEFMHLEKGAWLLRFGSGPSPEVKP